MTWVLARSGGDSTIAELCGSLEVGARLALLKARRLNGAWQVVADDTEGAAWGGPPPELPLRRSWLGERLAGGPLSFVAQPRAYETVLPGLEPIPLTGIRAAMLAVLNRQRPQPAPRVIPREPRLSTEVCSALILERLREHGEVSLLGIAGDSRDAHVAAFLSSLILARQGQITLEQDDLFGEVRLSLAAESLDATA